MMDLDYVLSESISFFNFESRYITLLVHLKRAKATALRFF